MNRWAILVKAGRIHDSESHRITGRLLKAQAILKSLGCVPVYPIHSAICSVHQRFPPKRCDCGIGLDATPTWPTWATNEMFELAWQLADEVSIRIGTYNRSLKPKRDPLTRDMR